MRSIAAVKSSSVTASPLRRVATMAASLTRLARSAPVKPGVSPATWSRSTFAASCTFGDMYLQDFQPSGSVGAVDHHLAVKPSGPQQGGIEHLRAIGGGEQDHARARIEAVELGEQLVERLLLLVITAECARYAATPQRVELIDEDDT